MAQNSMAPVLAGAQQGMRNGMTLIDHPLWFPLRGPRVHSHIPDWAPGWTLSEVAKSRVH